MAETHGVSDELMKPRFTTKESEVLEPVLYTKLCFFVSHLANLSLKYLTENWDKLDN